MFSYRRRGSPAAPVELAISTSRGKQLHELSGGSIVRVGESLMFIDSHNLLKKVSTLKILDILAVNN
jgi:hypothetical protein